MFNQSLLLKPWINYSGCISSVISIAYCVYSVNHALVDFLTLKLIFALYQSSYVYILTYTLSN